MLIAPSYYSYYDYDDMFSEHSNHINRHYNEQFRETEVLICLIFL